MFVGYEVIYMDELEGFSEELIDVLKQINIRFGLVGKIIFPTDGGTVYDSRKIKTR